MKKLKHVSIFILVGILLFSLFFPACGKDNHDSGSDTGNSNTATDSPNGSYTPYQPTHDDFEEDLVIVLIKPEYSEVNKPWYAEDFQLKGIGIEKIVDTRYQENPSDYSASPNFKQRLKLFLSEPSKENVIAAIHQIEVLYFVEWAIPEYNYGTADCYTPNDDYTLLQWGLDNTDGASIEKVWDFTTGSTTPRIKVGIFENNVQRNHEDLRVGVGNFYPTYDANDSDHGTHVAGIIGAISNNDIGVSGIAQVEIILLNRDQFVSELEWAGNNGVKIVNASFYYTTLDENNNWVPSPANPDHVDALQEFSTKGGIFIGAAGNDNNNADITSLYPGAYADKEKYPTLDNVISVGALNAEEDRCNFSNYGENSVSIYAPGENILSTFPTSLCLEYDYVFHDGTLACEMDLSLIGQMQHLIENYNFTWEYFDENFSSLYTDEGTPLEPIDYKASTHHTNGYHEMSGTSMAAPHVTGVAALLLSYNPNLTAAQLKTAILSGADEIEIEIPDGDDDDNLPDKQEVKKLNATKALQYVMDNYGSSSIISSTENTLSETVNGNSSYFEESNFMLALFVSDINKCNFSISSTSALDVTLYDSNLNEISIFTTSANNGCQIDFSRFLFKGKYYLQTSYVSETATGTINVTISGGAHTHLYTHRYIKSNATYHKEYCACGEFQLKPHIARIGDSGPSNTCALCGAILPTSGGLNSIQATATYVTLNGSFIAQNGIIYLVDADWDAYFAGTLQFYLNTNLPIVTNRVAIYGEGLL